MFDDHRIAWRVRRWGIGAGLVGGAVATVMIGLGTAHADPDALNVAATAASDESADGAIASQFGDWLNLAGDNFRAFVDDFFLNSFAGAPTDGTTTPAELLATASTNLTEGDNVLSSLPSSDHEIVSGLVGMQDRVGAIDVLQLAEKAISSHDGSLSGLVNQLVFDPIGQNWVHASEAVLNADHALATAITSDSGVDAAQNTLIWTDLQLGFANLSAAPVVDAAAFF